MQEKSSEPVARYDVRKKSPPTNVNAHAHGLWKTMCAHAKSSAPKTNGCRGTHAA